MSLTRKKQPVAVFDIDGTLFRSSLLIEFTEALIAEGIFPKRARRIYQHSYERWLDRTGPYEIYIEAVVVAFVGYLKGTPYADFERVAKNVVRANQHRLYRHTRDLVRVLKRRGYYLLAISNSPLGVLKSFCRTLGFDKVYGRIYELDAHERFTGKLVHEALITDKAKILHRAAVKENLTLDGSIGVGDTESDIPFLRLVAHPICFNPNQQLYRAAKRARWKVVVERKDVIYEISN